MLLYRKPYGNRLLDVFIGTKKLISGRLPHTIGLVHLDYEKGLGFWNLADGVQNLGKFSALKAYYQAIKAI